MDRQRTIETNRSLRTIKNELENLLEKGTITDEIFDSITNLLPSESSLNGPLPVRACKTAPPNPIISNAAPPPAYSQTDPPALPARNPPPSAPSKPVLAHARALYKYAAADSRDVSFEKEDKIAIYEYMNDDWWMGRNVRTGDEGIFPKTYVLVEEDEKKTAPPMLPVRTASGPSAPVNPYNSQVPPMAVAAEGHAGDGPSKANQQGKKFGKKLGNAAIFGAGATIGGKIVNSIF